MHTHWPRTPVEVSGRRFHLCFSLRAVAEAQQRFDSRGVDANLLDSLPVLNLANVRILFPCALKKYHPDLDFHSAQQLVTWEAVYTIAGALRAAWHAAAPNPTADRQGQPSATPKEPLSQDQQWERLWSLARYDLRLTTREFYNLTVGQLDALIRRRERDIQEREFMPAQIAACIVNFSMGRPKKPVEAKDFMPSEWAREIVIEKPKRRPRRIIAMEVRETMDAWMRGARG